MPFSSSLKSVLAHLEFKVAGTTIDSLGRRWDAAKHPRDSRGRFIETGGVARVGLGGLGRVIRSMVGGKVEVEMADGSHRIVPSQQLTMVQRPDGTKPTASVRKVVAEDARREADPTRGDGKYELDNGDANGNGIPDVEESALTRPDSQDSEREQDNPYDGDDDDPEIPEVPEAYTPSRDKAKPNDLINITRRNKNGDPVHLIGKIDTLDADGKPDQITFAGSAKKRTRLADAKAADYTVIPFEDLEDPAALLADAERENGLPDILDNELAADLVEQHSKTAKIRPPAAARPKVTEGGGKVERPVVTSEELRFHSVSRKEQSDGIYYRDRLVGTIEKIPHRDPAKAAEGENMFVVTDAWGRGKSKNVPIKRPATDDMTALDQLAKLLNDPPEKKVKPAPKAKAPQAAAPAAPDAPEAVDAPEAPDAPVVPEKANVVTQSVAARQPKASTRTTTADGRTATRSASGNLVAVKEGNEYGVYRKANAGAPASEDQIDVDGQTYVKSGNVRTLKEFREGWAGTELDRSIDSAPEADAPLTPTAPQAAPEAPNAPEANVEAPAAPSLERIEKTSVRDLSDDELETVGMTDGLTTPGRQIDALDELADRKRKQTAAAEQPAREQVNARIPEQPSLLDTPTPEAPKKPSVREFIGGRRGDFGDDVKNSLYNEAPDKFKDAIDALTPEQQDKYFAERIGQRPHLAALRSSKNPTINTRDESDKSTTPTPESRPADAPEQQYAAETNEGATDDAVRGPRTEVLGDVPTDRAAADSAGAEDGVLRGDRNGSDRDGGDAGRGEPAGEQPAGRQPGASAPEGRNGEGQGRGGSARGARVPAEGARDRGQDDADLGGSGSDRDAVAPAPAGDFNPTGQDDLAPKGVDDKLAANMAALRLLRQMQADGRTEATPDEQATLAKFAGWGSLPRVFNLGDDKYAAERTELRDLLGEEEYEAALDNALNAHYTDAKFVKPMWDLMESLGFQGGDVLEAGSGTGNFIGFAPDGARMHGVEKNDVTAGIAQRLYPSADIRNESFGDTDVAPNEFDAMIGNVPFGNFPVFDPIDNPGNYFNIHDHFMLKGARGLKPGGVMAVLTSAGTMDKKNGVARKKLDEMGMDLVGAVRLPNGAHQDAAGTTVLTDVLVLRKRKDGEPEGDKTWLESADTTLDDGATLPMNAYYAKHPENVLGESRADTSRFSGNDVVGVKGDLSNLDTRMGEALSRIAADATASGKAFAPEGEKGTAPKRKQSRRAAAKAAKTKAPSTSKASASSEVYTAPSERTQAREQQKIVGQITHTGTETVPGKKPGTAGSLRHTFTMVDFDGSEKEYKPAGAASAGDNKSQADELAALLRLRDIAADLREAEAESLTDTDEMADLRADLNEAYDDYASKFGPIGRMKRSRAKVAVKDPTDDNETDGLTMDDDGQWYRTTFIKPQMGGIRKDATWWSVTGLETDYDEDSNTAKKAAIFERRTVGFRSLPTSADNPRDAVALSREYDDTIDMDRIASLLGVSREEAEAQTAGLVYENHLTGELEDARVYLSGNVRRKAAELEALAAEDPKWTEQARAMRAVVPVDKKATDISARLGMAWLPESDMQDFLRFITGNDRAQLGRDDNGTWETKPVVQPRARNAAREGGSGMERPYGHVGPLVAQFGTSRRTSYQLVESLLKGQRPVVKDKDEDKREYINVAETEAAQVVMEKIAGEFDSWWKRDTDRRDRLTTTYNELYRSHTDVNYVDSPYSEYVGMSDSIELDPHQNDSVAMAKDLPSVMLAHEVGTGKTFTMAAAVMEKKRLGQVQKPVIVVPNHLLEQFVREFKVLYPNANLLAGDSNSVKDVNDRRRFAAQAGSHDWDAVVMTKNAFRYLPVSEATASANDEAKIAELRAKRDALLMEKGETKQVKTMGEQIARLEAKLEELRDRIGGDVGAIDFENIGFDYVVVDEAHEYKNDLIESSERALQNLQPNLFALDLREKLDWLRENAAARGSKSIALFATGTPVSNSTREFYVMMRFLRPDLLAEGHIEDFDDFRAAYLQTEESVEQDVAGRTKVKVREGDALINAGELKRLWVQFADEVTADDIGLERPKLKNGQGTKVVVGASDPLRQYMRHLAYRQSQIKPSFKPEPGDDTHVAIGTDGLTAAVDLRLLPRHKIEEAGIDYDALTIHDGKLARIGDRVLAEWERTKDMQFKIKRDSDKDAPTKGAAQIVFLDKGVPGGSAPISAYDEIKDYLVAGGMKPNEIAFIHDAAGDPMKMGKISEQVRNGELKVLIGSTPKMGTGLNVQNRLSMLHHADGAYRPDQIEQRNGRVVRRGNQFNEVEVAYYPVEGSNEGFQWAHVARKDNFLRQFAEADLDATIVGSLESDIPSEADTIAALGSEDPLVMEETTLKLSLRKQKAAANSWQSAQDYHQNNATQNESRAARLTAAQDKLRAAGEKVVPTTGDAFSIGILPNSWSKAPETTTDRKAAVEALSTWAENNLGLEWAPNGDGRKVKVGTLGGLEVYGWTHKSWTGKTSVRWGVAETDSTLPSYVAPEMLDLPMVETDSTFNAGTITRLENMVAGVTERPEVLQRIIDKATAEAAESRGQLGGEFAERAELDALETRHEALRALMRSGDEADKPALRELYDAATRRWESIREARLATGEAPKVKEMGEARTSRRKVKGEKKAAERAQSGEEAPAPRKRTENATEDSSGAAKTVTGKARGPRPPRPEGGQPRPAPAGPVNPTPAKPAKAESADPVVLADEIAKTAAVSEQELLPEASAPEEQAARAIADPEGDVEADVEAILAVHAADTAPTTDDVPEGTDLSPADDEPTEVLDEAADEPEAPAGLVMGNEALNELDNITDDLSEYGDNDEQTLAGKYRDDADAMTPDELDALADAADQRSDMLAEDRDDDESQDAAEYAAQAAIALRKAASEKRSNPEPTDDAPMTIAREDLPATPDVPEGVPSYGDKITLTDGRTVTFDQDSFAGFTARDADGNSIDLTEDELTGWKPFDSSNEARDEVLEGTDDVERVTPERAPRAPKADAPTAEAGDADQGAVEITDVESNPEQPTVMDGIREAEAAADLPAARYEDEDAAREAGFTEPVADVADLSIGDVVLMGLKRGETDEAAIARSSWIEGRVISEPKKFGTLAPQVQIEFDHPKLGRNTVWERADSLWTRGDDETMTVAPEDMPATPDAPEADGAEEREQADRDAITEARTAAEEEARDGGATEEEVELAGEVAAADEATKDAEQAGERPVAPAPKDEPKTPRQLDDEDYPLSTQQQPIADAVVADRETVLVEAKAGAGKTSTLVAIAKRFRDMVPDAKIGYIAFNKSVQTEAESRFPKNTETRTGHSVSFAWAGKKFTDARFKNADALRNSKEIADHLGMRESLGSGTPADNARDVMRAVKRYSNSADDKITAEHFVTTEGKDLLDGFSAEHKAKMLGFADLAWKDLTAEKGRLNTDNDHIRKMWALSKPDFSKPGSGLKSPVNVLFLDEAQDTPPVLAKVIEDQTMQKVIVGDGDQAIYGFTGAIDYLAKADVSNRMPLTKSYRFGPQVADWGNRFLQVLGSEQRVVGGGPDSAIVEKMDAPDAILTRSNGGMFTEILAEQEAGRIVGVPTGTKGDLRNLIASARYLRDGGTAPNGGMHEDLAPFNTWDEFEQAVEKGDDQKLASLDRLFSRYTMPQMYDIVESLVEDGENGLSGVNVDTNDDRMILSGGATGKITANLKRDTGSGIGQFGFRWNGTDKTWVLTGNKAKQDDALGRLKEALGGDARKPEVTVSTAHKAKGLEWSRVRIGDDFRGPKVDPTTGEETMPAPEELRLAYVAVTRAEKELDLGSLAWVGAYSSENGKDPIAAPVTEETIPEAPAADVTPEVAEETMTIAPEDLPATPEVPEATDEPAARPGWASAAWDEPVPTHPTPDMPDSAYSDYDKVIAKRGNWKRLKDADDKPYDVIEDPETGVSIRVYKDRSGMSGWRIDQINSNGTLLNSGMTDTKTNAQKFAVQDMPGHVQRAKDRKAQAERLRALDLPELEWTPATDGDSSFDAYRSGSKVAMVFPDNRWTAIDLDDPERTLIAGAPLGRDRDDARAQADRQINPNAPTRQEWEAARAAEEEDRNLDGVTTPAEQEESEDNDSNDRDAADADAGAGAGDGGAVPPPVVPLDADEPNDPDDVPTNDTPEAPAAGETPEARKARRKRNSRKRYDPQPSPDSADNGGGGGMVPPVAPLVPPLFDLPLDGDPAPSGSAAGAPTADEDRTATDGRRLGDLTVEELGAELTANLQATQARLNEGDTTEVNRLSEIGDAIYRVAERRREDSVLAQTEAEQARRVNEWTDLSDVQPGDTVADYAKNGVEVTSITDETLPDGRPGKRITGQGYVGEGDEMTFEERSFTWPADKRIFLSRRGDRPAIEAAPEATPAVEDTDGAARGMDWNGGNPFNQPALGRIKVSPGLAAELGFYLENGEQDGNDQGYTLAGSTMVVHDKARALSALDAIEDIKRNQAEDGDRGAGSIARAAGARKQQVSDLPDPAPVDPDGPAMTNAFEQVQPESLVVGDRITGKLASTGEEGDLTVESAEQQGAMVLVTGRGKDGNRDFIRIPAGGFASRFGSPADDGTLENAWNRQVETERVDPVNGEPVMDLPANLGVGDVFEGRVNGRMGRWKIVRGVPNNNALFDKFEVVPEGREGDTPQVVNLGKKRPVKVLSRGEVTPTAEDLAEQAAYDALPEEDRAAIDALFTDGGTTPDAPEAPAAPEEVSTGDLRPEPLVNGALTNPLGLVAPADEDGDYSPEQVQFLVDEAAGVVVSRGGKDEHGTFMRVTPDGYLFRPTSSVGDSESEWDLIPHGAIDSIEGINSIQSLAEPVDPAHLRPGTLVAFTRDRKRHLGVLDGVGDDGRAVVIDALGQRHETTKGGTVRPVMGGYRDGYTPTEAAFAPKPGVWGAAGNGGVATAEPGKWAAGIVPAADEDGFVWQLDAITPNRGMTGQETLASGRADSIAAAQEAITDALFLNAEQRGFSVLPGANEAERDRNSGELAETLSALRGGEDEVADDSATDETADAPDVEGASAGWVPTGELSPGDVASVEGDNGNGSATTRTGHVLGTPESVEVHSPGKKPEKGTRTVVGDDTDGLGDRETILSPEASMAARAEREMDEHGTGDNPASAYESEILSGNVGDTMPKDANGLGIFPGSVVVGTGDRRGVVREVWDRDVAVRWDGGEDDERMMPGKITVSPDEQARPEGWTRGGRLVAAGQLVVLDNGDLLGTVESVAGDDVVVKDAAGNARTVSAADLIVSGKVADKAPDVVEDSPYADPPSIDGLDVRPTAPAKPADLPEGVPTVNPNLKPEHRKALEDLGLDTDSITPMDVQEAAARVRFGMPITQQQADDLAAFLGALQNSATIPSGRARSIQRLRNRLTAAADRLGDRNTRPAPEAPRLVPAGDLVAGDVVALPNPATGEVESGTVRGAWWTQNGQVKEVIVEGQDGALTRHKLLPDADTYLLPDLDTDLDADEATPEVTDAAFTKPRVNTHAQDAAQAVVDAAVGESESEDLDALRDDVAGRLESGDVERDTVNSGRRTAGSLERSGVTPESVTDAREAGRQAAEQVADEVAETIAKTLDDAEPLPGESQSDAADRVRDRLREAADDVDLDSIVDSAMGEDAKPTPKEQAKARREVADAMRADLFALADELAALGNTEDANLLSDVAARLAGRPDEANVQAAAKALAMGREPGKVRSLVTRVRAMFARARRRFFDKVRSLMGLGPKASRSLTAAVAAARAEWKGDDAAVKSLVADAAKAIATPEAPAAAESGEPFGFGERVEFWRNQLPGDSSLFGRTEKPKRGFRGLSLASLRGGEPVQATDTTGSRVDRARDGGPGKTAMGHYAAVQGLGAAMDDEVNARIRAALPEQADPAADLAELRRHAAEIAEQERGDLTDDELAEMRAKVRAVVADAEREFFTAKAKAVREVLASVRPMGARGAVGLNVQGRGADADEVKALEWAEQFIPSDWLATAGTVEAQAGRMGSYAEGTITVAPLGEGKVDGSGKYGASALHGLAHHLETTVPGLADAGWMHQWAKTSTGEPGSRVRRGRNGLAWLKDRFPGAGFSKDDGTVRWAWDALEEEGVNHYEWIPAGFADLFGDDIKDDDLRKFMLGLLAYLGKKG